MDPIAQLLDDLREVGVSVPLEPGPLMGAVFDTCVYGSTPMEACGAHGLAPETWAAWEARVRDLHGLVVEGRVASDAPCDPPLAALEPRGSMSWLDVESEVLFADRGRRFAVLAHRLERGGILAPIHRNLGTDILRRVESGCLVQRVGGKRIRLRAGGLAFIHRGAWHAAWNASTSEPVRIVDTFAPAGLERFVEDLAHRSSVSGVAALYELARSHGVEVASPETIIPALSEMAASGAALADRVALIESVPEPG